MLLQLKPRKLISLLLGLSWKDEWRQLEVGMVLTVEPGLYISPDCEKVAAKWRGIGVRIEDDVLVTKTGHEVMTDAAPKHVIDIEQLMRG